MITFQFTSLWKTDYSDYWEIYLSCSQWNQNRARFLRKIYFISWIFLYIKYIYDYIYLELKLFEILIEENNYLFIFYVEFFSNLLHDHKNHLLAKLTDISHVNTFLDHLKVIFSYKNIKIFHSFILCIT